MRLRLHSAALLAALLACTDRRPVEEQPAPAQHVLPSFATLHIAVQGEGSVATAEPLLGCPGPCSTTVARGTHLTLVATPHPLWRFAGWSGACSGTDSCQVDLSEDVSVGAVFSASVLRVVVNGPGAVVLPDGTSCRAGECIRDVAAGSRVVLRADAAWPSFFMGWSGACSGSSECTATIDGITSVTANFGAYRRLEVTASGAGAVFRELGARQALGEQYVAPGTGVWLTAAPVDGWVFKGWSGGCAGTSDCLVYVNDDTSVAAHFEPAAPPPPKCSTLMPASIPAPAFVPADDVCPQGTSDGEGTFAVASCGGAVTYRFYDANGVATAALPVPAAGEVVHLYGEDAGFLEVTVDRATLDLTLAVLSHDGVPGPRTTIARGRAESSRTVWAPDPAGGAIVLAPVAGSLHFRRFDGNGTEAATADLEGSGKEPVLTAISGSGHVLVVATVVGTRQQAAEWLDKDGNVLVPWFNFLPDSADPPSLEGMVIAGGLVFADLSTQPAYAPQWFRARFGLPVAVRGGAAFASVNQSCTEILTPEGNPCGCLPPEVRTLSIGRGGSIIGAAGGASGPGFNLYPGLLK